MDKARILIVEDEAVISLSLCEVLGLVGLDVVGVAANVTDALCIAENTHPDLAIFDIHLQGQRDGIEGARLLRQRFNVPVVFMTANGDQDMRARASEIEPAAYLTKPVHPKRLIAAIENALQASRAERANSSK
jgi:two-component system, response regulator PdtaR